ncbi:MAG: sigma factor, partial [Actinomycetota bacterium]
MQRMAVLACLSSEVHDDDASLDREALRHAFEMYRLRLLRLASLLSGSPAIADDMVQDVFVRAARKVGMLDEAEIYPYLHRSVVNAWRNDVRHRKVAERVEWGHPQAAGAPDEGLSLWAE